MENRKPTQLYLAQSFTDWMRGGCLYLAAANDKTRELFEQGRVHTPFFDDTYTYEKRYIVKILTKELYRWN